MYSPRTQIYHRDDYRTNRNRAATNFVNRDRNLTRNFDHQEVVQFRPSQNPETVDSGVCSPPLWKNTAPSPPRSPSQPLLGDHNYVRSLSPNSRAQAIARGQWELMEMVRNMPESSYELSLKDIVEHPRNQSDDYQRSSPSNLGPVRVKKQDIKRIDKKNVMIMRSGSFENNKGLFLNMVFPFSPKSKKKKKNLGSGNTSGKVSPKPEGVKGGGEKDWWKKRFTGSSDSESSRTSNNTASTGSSSGLGSSRSNSGSRKKNGLLTGCWGCLQSRSTKSV